MRIPGSTVAAGIVAFAIAALSPAYGVAEGASAKININVGCRCTDPVGENFCRTFKEKIAKSIGYQLSDNTGGYGMGVHFACEDMWTGIDNKLKGRMSAVSVTFTIYSDKLPGEVFEDSSVFRVGKGKVSEMSEQIVTALGQFVGANSTFFESMRTGTLASPPEASSEPSSEPSSAPSP